jgi:phosphomannomutase/phosphoglucomutase
MNIDPSIFRAYDIRGVYPKQLNEEGAFRIALAFSSLYPQTKKIVVASDSRLSSPPLKKVIIEAFLKSGKTVIDLGIAPDPLFYFAIFHFRFDGGVMISGSHNPKEYNGLTLHIRKEKKERSEDLIGEDLNKIKEIVIGGKEIQVPKKKGEKNDLDVSEEYIKYVVPRVKIKRPLKIIIDSGNGAMGFLPEKVFKALGCQAGTIYGEPDGNFPHHPPDPYERENLADIKKEVLSGGYDLGLAFDADGDRVCPIDNKGREVSGDSCLFMLALQVLQKKKGPVVHCMRVSRTFLDEMKRQEVPTYFSVSHHSAVLSKILKTKAVFGGEITYHFLFPLDYYLVDDALFPSLKIAEAVSQKEDFANYLDTLPRYATSPEIFIPAEDTKKFELIRNLQKYLRENNYDFIDIDGARINFDNGWALARASNTSPFIKCRFEGRTQKDLKEIIGKSLSIFEKAGLPFSENIVKELKNT